MGELAATMLDRLKELMSISGVAVAGLSLAAFLALFWLLRGAPPGQAADESGASDESPGTGYRDRVVAAAVIGMVLLGVGAYLAMAVSIPWALAPLAAGFATLLVLVSTNRRHRHASPTLRRVVQFADAAATGGLLAGVLVVGNVVAFKYGGRPLDFTAERAYSLAPQTLNVLRSLDRPVRFTAYFGSREPAVRVLQLLKLYQDAAPARIVVDDINPFRDVDRFNALRERVSGVIASEGLSGVVVEYGEGEARRSLVLQLDELFDPVEGQGARFETTFRGEDALTSALIRLEEGKRSPVAFTTGHGEPSGDPADRTQANSALLRERLEASGSVVRDVNLATGTIPEGAELVVIAGPRDPFRAEEVEKLRLYLAGGGHLLAIVGNEGPTGLEDLLRSYNIAIGTGRIVDPEAPIRGRPTLLVVPLGTVPHPVVETLSRRVALFPDAAPITILGEPTPDGPSPTPASPGVVATAIVRTTPTTWAESDPTAPPLRREPGEPAGPLTVGVAATDRGAHQSTTEAPETPRLVVFSGRDLAGTFYIQNAVGNLDLLMNAAYWLRGRPELMGIAPKTHVALTFAPDPRLRANLILVPTLMAALVIVGLGVSVYLNRRD